MSCKTLLRELPASARIFDRHSRLRTRRCVLIGDSRFETSLKRRTEFPEVPKTDSLADFGHDVKVKVDVMEGVQSGAENFVRDEKVAQIRTRIAAARRTFAIRVERARIFRVARLLDE